MLASMIGKLLLKVGLSLGLLLGIASYGHHLAGGDPGALWNRVAGGAVSGVADSFGELRGAIGTPTVAAFGGGTRSDSVFTWRDADGVVHFTSEPPPLGIDAEVVTVNPDTNVLAPVAAPETTRGRPGRGETTTSDGGAGGATSGGPGSAGTSASASRRGREGTYEASEPLPGIAGVVLRARGDAPAPDPARAEALLRSLQAPTD